LLIGSYAMLPNNLFAFVKLWVDYWKPVETVYYDTQTLSMLQTDQRFPSVSSQKMDLL
jgi:hypothetical protein